MPYKAPLKRFQVDLLPRERVNNFELVDNYQPIFNDAEDMAFQYIFNALPLWYMFMQYHDKQVITLSDQMLAPYGLNSRKVKHQKPILLDQGYMALTQFENVFCVSDMPFEEPPLICYEDTIITENELKQPCFEGVETWDKRKNFYFIRKKIREVNLENKAYIDRYVKHFNNTFTVALNDLQEYCWLYSWCLRNFSSMKNPNFEHFLSGEFFLKTYNISYHDTRQAIHALNNKGYLPYNSDKNLYVFHEKVDHNNSQQTP